MNTILIAAIFVALIGPTAPSLARQYDLAVVAYNRAEYPNGIAPGMQVTNWTEGHAVAEEKLEAYLARAGTNAEPMAYLLLGELQRKQGRQCGSIAFYQEAIRRGPSRYICHHAGVNLAYAAIRCGGTNVEVALSTICRITNRHPCLRTNRDVSGCLAHVYRRMGYEAYYQTDYASATIYYQKAVELRPLWPDLANDLAVTYLRLAEIARDEGAGRVFQDYVHKAYLLVNRKEFQQYRWPKIEGTREYIRTLL